MWSSVRDDTLVDMSEPVVEMTNVTKKYGDVVAVESISLRV
jgi:hypothetical protein